MEQNKRYEVTILLPAYNEAGVIGETIRAIRAQHPDFEILVVDDGSTDNTMREAMEAGANVWPHPYNMGNGAAIKSGLRCARGTGWRDNAYAARERSRSSARRSPSRTGDERRLPLPQRQREPALAQAIRSRRGAGGSRREP